MIKQHPLSTIFPAMSDAAFGELRADIAANGLHQPIVLFQDQVLDGWHRYLACTQTGTELATYAFEGDEAAARKYVVSANLLRRHLDASARGMLAGRLAQVPHGGDRGNQHTGGKWQETNSSLGSAVTEAAELLNVGTTTVKDAHVVLASGDADLIAAVERGEKSVSGAAKEVRNSRPKRAKQPKASVSTAIQIIPKTIEQWALMPEADRALYCTHRNPSATLNQQKSGEDDNLIDWARWTWNPITGCLHNCPYCYARDIAERFSGSSAYPNGFTPTFRADHLSAPLNTRPRQSDDERDGRIFTGSMTDVFGRWVPAEWIEAVLQVMCAAPQWEFLTLTKFPKRMAEFDIPSNAWAGTSVDCQARVNAAEAAFESIGGKYHWLSCEPLIEPLRFKHLDRFDLIVIGGASPSRQTPRWIPPFSWLDDLMRQADEAGCAVFLKSNLYRKETPRGKRYSFLPAAPPEFHYLRGGDPDQRAA